MTIKTISTLKDACTTKPMPRDLDLRSFDPKINGFPSLLVEQLYVTFCDLSCSSYWDIMWKNRQNHRQMPLKTLSH